jgi:hypothetical protein
MIILLTSTTAAHADSLWEAEVRAGYGIAVGGNGDMVAARSSPLTLAATASIAVNEDPLLFGFGGVSIETLDRGSIGALGGIRLQSASSPLRFATGGSYVFAPKTMWGAFASGGACHRTSTTMKVCGDLMVTSYFEGTDLPTGHTVTEAQLVLGMVLDAP